MADERLEVELSVDTKGAEKINDVSNDIRKLGNDVSSTGSKLSGGTNSIRNFVNSFNSFNNVLNKASRKYNQTFRSFNRTLVNGLKDAGRDIKDFTKDAIDSYTKLSEQHAKTMGVIANSGDYNINTKSGQKKFADDSNKLEKQAIKIAKYGTNGNGSLYDVTKVSEAQSELLKAGVPKKAILNDGVLETILEFAQANDLDVSKSIGFAQALGNQFNVKYKDWGSMLDKVSHAADLSTIDVSDVVQSMKYAGGITSGLNRNIDEVLGLTAMMGNFGLKGSQSGSAIQALYTRLLTGDTTVITDRQKEVAPPKALKAFYDFSKYAKSDGSGLEYKQIKNAKSYDKLGKLSGNLRPMDEVTDKLDEVMSGLNDEEQAWFAKKFFGLYQMKGAYALINGDNKSVDKYISEINNDSKDTNKNKLDQLLNSQYGRTTSLENLWNTTKTELGGDLSPIVNAVRDQLFNYLKNNGNYEIDVQPIRDALNDCSDVIGEKYGESIGNLVNNIGNTVIDVADISKELAPEFAKGIVNILNKLADGDIFGAFGEWNDMIGKMDDAVDGLPDELRDLGDAITGVIDFFGKFAAFNLGARIVQTLSSAIRAISIAGGAIIKAGSVVVNGGVTGGTGGGSGTSGKGGSTGGGTGSSQPQTLSRGQKATNAVKFVGGTAGGIAGAYGGEQLGSWVVDQFGGNETQQGIGGIVGGTIGAAAGYKAGSWATGKAISAGSKLLPALNSAKDSAYLYGLYGLDALSADALVGGTAGSSAAAIAGSLALPAAVVAGSGYMFYDMYTTGKQNQKDAKQIANMSKDEHPLFDKDDNIMRNEDGSLTTIDDLIHNINKDRKTASKYAYDGAYNKEERVYIESQEPENPVKWYNPFTWGGDDDYELRLEEYNKGKKRIAARKEEEEKYFYKIQDKLYNDSGIYLTNTDFQKDGNSKKLIDWYKSLSTNNPVDFSSLDLGKDGNGRNITKKFSKSTNEWAYAYIDQVYSALKNAGIEFDINDFKPSDILNGTKKGKGKKTSKQNANVIEENTRNYIKKVNKDNTNNDIASIINKSIIDRLNNNLVNNAVQVTDNSSINIQPTTTPVTVQPNINISVNVDKDGNAKFTPSQQNTLFDLYTNWSVNKSRSYNTSNKSTKKKG